MRAVKIVEKQLTKDLVQMLDLSQTIDQLAIVNSVHWYGHILWNDENAFHIMALDLTVKGTSENLAKGSSRTEWKRWAEQ